jgi:hypothetical protein
LRNLDDRFAFPTVDEGEDQVARLRSSGFANSNPVFGLLTIHPVAFPERGFVGILEMTCCPSMHLLEITTAGQLEQFGTRVSIEGLGR